MVTDEHVALQGHRYLKSGLYTIKLTHNSQVKVTSEHINIAIKSAKSYTNSDHIPTNKVYINNIDCAASALAFHHGAIQLTPVMCAHGMD